MGFFWVFIGIMFLMGGMLGAAIIFNGVTVNVLQRTREIAVMRAVGMYRKTITLIVTLENLGICLLGILVGLPLGRYTAEGLMKSMSTSTEDLFSFSLVISNRTYWIAAIFAVVIILLSQLPAIRRVTNMDLTVATKENAE
jgi:putative ABC transport system permease protein